MARTLIETPFPSTAEVARKLGVSPERVRSLAKLLLHDTVSSQISRQGKAKSVRAKSFKKAPPTRN